MSPPDVSQRRFTFFRPLLHFPCVGRMPGLRRRRVGVLYAIEIKFLAGQAGAPMNWVPVILCGALGFGLVWIFLALIIRHCQSSKPVRDSDLHHTHQGQIPRVGGLGLVGAFIILELFIALVFPESYGHIPSRPAAALSCLAMFGLGFWDDLRPLGARRKLLAQIFIALLACYFGLQIELFKIPFTGRVIALGGWSCLVTTAWLVGITNVMNLIDGVDGLAGGIALMLMALLVYVGSQNGTYVLLTAGMTGALLGFLQYNFPPARIYLGDGGAYFLGFQIGLFSIIGSHKGSVVAALIAPLFVLALPIVDAALAILRRGLQGLPVFRPDRRHLHHRLLKSGMSRRQVVLAMYGVSLLFLFLGFAAFWSRGHLVPVLSGLAALILLLCAGKLNFSREWFAVGRTLGNSLALRREVQYALALTSWLKREGGRSPSLRSLFEDLVFAARRLGFTSVKLTLADGQRSWGDPERLRPRSFFRRELRSGRFGVLELGAPVCAHSTGVRHPNQLCPGPACPCVGDPRLFEIMSELLAEGWIAAAGRARPSRSQLRFDLKSDPGRSRSRDFWKTV